MRINNYSIFLESRSNMSIYDYWSYLKNIRYDQIIDESEFKNHVEHFIGKGQWDLINGHFQKIFDILDSVDIDYINDRIYDIFDEYLFCDMNYVVRAVAYGDIDGYHKDNQYRYNGMMSVTTTDNNRKLHIICNFLRDMLNSVISYIDFGHAGLRKYPKFNDDQLLVTSDEFSIKNFANQKIDFDGSEKSAGVFSISKYKKSQSEFSIERWLDMYRPCVFLSISNSQITLKISRIKITKEFEEFLPAILPELDYEEVIWPWQSRLSGEDHQISEFDVKILLKM
jgi:hypothetical protein